MSNSADATPRREEEIAFLAMEQVLGINIKLADAGGGSKMPDGCWVDSNGRGIVEVTSPPAKERMAARIQAKREGRQLAESGSFPLRLNDLAEVCAELLDEGWAIENVRKLQAQPAEERHLFLFARDNDVDHYFCRLSDSYDDGSVEQVDDIVLSEGISAVWFRGRARRDSDQVLGPIVVQLARFQAAVGWRRHVVEVEEQDLPSPSPGLVDDPVPVELRRPRDRRKR